MKRRETIVLKFVNEDVMAHNLVIVSPGLTKKAGEASFKMVSNPKAAELNFTPDLPEACWVAPVIEPGNEYVLYFRAPPRRGNYPYICPSPVTGRPCKASCEPVSGHE